MTRVLALIGSPKPSASASLSFADALGSRLAVRGCEVRTERMTPAFGSVERTTALLDAIAEADLVVLAFPVYVDSLPAPVTALLEAWEEARREGRLSPGPAGLAVLTQCGFPEARHCDVAIEVCRTFAEHTGTAWLGALAFGMGGAIEGRPPEQSPLARRLEHLDAAADALVAGEVIPPEATLAFAEPLAPPWLYPLVGGFIWGRQAKRRGADAPLKTRRYAQ